MSGTNPPTPRPRTKNALDFLRGGRREDERDSGSLMSPKHRPSQPIFPTASTSSHQPSSSPSNPTATSTEPLSPKSKLSFPFILGRSRKKSQNATPSVDARAQTNAAILRSSSNLKRVDSERLVDIGDAPGYPSPVLTPSAKSSAASFGAKISAHLTPSKSRRSLHTPSEISPDLASPREDNIPFTSSLSSLHPPESKYFDSVSSSNSSAVPVTPKPTPQPTITVSVPADSLVEEYHEIFTYAPGSFNNRSSEQIHPREVRIHGEDHPAFEPKRSRSVSIKSSQSEGSRRKPSSHHRDATESKRRTIEVSSYSRIVPSRSLTTVKRSGTPSLPDNPPPPMPLPPAPQTSPSMTSFPSMTSITTISSLRSTDQVYPLDSRRRAHTISTSLAKKSTHMGPPSPPIPANGHMVDLEQFLSEINADKENLDETSVEELRRIIKTERARFSELASYLTTMLDIHSAEKSSLERRISLLEKEAKKKEKEMKGLRWLVMNDANGGSTVSGASSGCTLDSMPPMRPPVRRYRSNSLNQSNAARALPGSGTETDSLTRTSGLETTASDSNLGIILAKRRKRHVSIHHRTGSSSLGLEFSASSQTSLNNPYLTPIATKRSSVSSITSSPTSSTSSLGLPVSVSGLSAGLTAIPEGPPTPLGRFYQGTASGSDTMVPSRTPSPEAIPSVSVSSLDETASASSVPVSEHHAATTAYAANLKKGRPASISQVLQQGSEMDSALEKMRLFGMSASTPSF